MKKNYHIIPVISPLLKLDTFHLVMFLWFHKITFLFVIHIINGVVLDFQAEALKPQVKFFWLDCWVL